jgi:hypothetical protein
MKSTKSKMDDVNEITIESSGSDSDTSSICSSKSSCSGSGSSSVSVGDLSEVETLDGDGNEIDMTLLDWKLGKFYENSFEKITFPRPGTFTSTDLGQFVLYRLVKLASK